MMEALIVNQQCDAMLNNVKLQQCDIKTMTMISISPLTPIYRRLTRLIFFRGKFVEEVNCEVSEVRCLIYRQSV